MDGFGKFVFVENYNNWKADSKEFNALYYDLKRRTEDGIITLYFYSLSSLKEEDIVPLFAKFLERAIKLNPFQFFHFYDFFD